MIYWTVLSYNGTAHVDFPVHLAFSHEAVLKFVKYLICMEIVMCFFLKNLYFFKLYLLFNFLAVLGERVIS